MRTYQTISFIRHFAPLFRTILTIVTILAIYHQLKGV